MLSASRSRVAQLAPEQLWGRARATMGGGLLWSALLVLLLTFAIARSTATAGWVAGIDVITLIALVGALVMAVLAVLPVPWPAALGAGMILGPVVAAVEAWPVIHAAHPLDVLNTGLIGIWWGRVNDGSATNDPSFYLFLICWLMWITGAWLSWCVLRWRKPMLGLIPGAAAFATNLLNVPLNQNGYTLSILVLTLALLLWTNYTASITSANRAHVKLTGDARWDFWESGLVAMAALIVLAIMLPPLSTVDLTTTMESSLFSNWAQLQESLNSHPGALGVGSGGGFTGFSADVALGGPLTRTKDPVFTYTVIGDYAGPRYFRGVNETSTFAGEWRYGASGLRESIGKGQVAVYSEDYSKLAFAGAAVKMLRPPVGNSDVVFYPGEFYRIDRPTIAAQAGLAVAGTLGDFSNLYSIDRLASAQPPTDAGSYTVTVEYSSATDADLQKAGTNYPDWLQQFSTLPSTTYRSPDVIQKIHDLAQTIVTQAGATNPYDEATAIQNYLRDPGHYQYTLAPVTPPPGMDKLYYFLFVSKRGYCEFFASAMGDMLRSLGIPTRLVNGFGPGTFDSTTHEWIVRGEDAHTWVESYFPGYGWIPFEPTPDIAGGYEPIARGAQGQSLCLRDENCDPGSTGTTGGTAPTPSALPPGFREPANPGSGPTALGLRVPDAATLTTILGVLLAVVLLLAAAVARYLRPRTVMGVWKRTLALAELAGAKRRPGETPLELGRRLQHTFPEASEPVGALAGGFVVAAYAPEDVAASARSGVMEAWTALRPLLIRRVLARLRPNRPLN